MKIWTFSLSGYVDKKYFKHFYQIIQILVKSLNLIITENMAIVSHNVVGRAHEK